MSKEKIELELQRIDGQQCMYNSKNIQIESTAIEGSMVIIKTEHREIKIPTFSAIADLKAFKVIDPNHALVPKVQIATSAIVGKDVMVSLKETLLENILKVKESKEYIPQAAQINKDVNSLVNLAKHELQLIKMSQPKLT